MEKRALRKQQAKASGNCRHEREANYFSYKRKPPVTRNLTQVGPYCVNQTIIAVQHFITNQLLLAHYFVCLFKVDDMLQKSSLHSLANHPALIGNTFTLCSFYIS